MVSYRPRFIPEAASVCIEDNESIDNDMKPRNTQFAELGLWSLQAYQSRTRFVYRTA